MSKQGHMPLLTYQQYVRHLTYMLRLKLTRDTRAL